jgi:hypothetical protein
VSRAVAGAGATLTLKDDIKGRASNSAIERNRPTLAGRTKAQDTQDTGIDGHDEFMDQLSEDSTRPTTPSQSVAPASPPPTREPYKDQLLPEANMNE